MVRSSNNGLSWLGGWWMIEEEDDNQWWWRWHNWLFGLRRGWFLLWWVWLRWWLVEMALVVGPWQSSVANSGYGWEDGMLCVLVLKMKGTGWELQKPPVFFAGVLGKSKACGGSTSLVFFCPARLVLAPPVAIVALLLYSFWSAITEGRLLFCSRIPARE